MLFLKDCEAFEEGNFSEKYHIIDHKTEVGKQFEALLGLWHLTDYRLDLFGGAIFVNEASILEFLFDNFIVLLELRVRRVRIQHIHTQL
jgi:hypothetical protein